jgi:type IV pilus assembly protein PilM
MSRRMTVGVDLAASAVRVAAVAGTDAYGFARVVRAVSAPLPAGAIVAGEVKQPVVVASALANALAEAKVPKRGIVVATSSRNVAVNQLPSAGAIQPAERTQALRMARTEISPTVPLAQSALSWNTVRSDVTGEGQTVHTLNVAVALQSDIEALVKVCGLAGAVAQAVDLSAAALLRSMARVGPDDTDIATVVDIGATKTVVATREGAALRSVRVFPFGGTNITRSLMTTMDVAVEEAENRKRYLSLPGASSRPKVAATNAYAEAVGSDAAEAAVTSAEDVLAKSAEQLIEEIAKSVAADARDHGARPTRGIQLIGGGSRLRGLPERLSDRIGVPVALAAPWAVLSLTRTTPRSASDAELTEFATAIGLALWRRPS